MNTDLIPWNTVQSIVERYRSAAEKVEQAKNLCLEATELARPMRTYWTPEIHDGYHERADNVIPRLKAATWAHIIEKLGVRKMMSIKRQQELDAELNNNMAKNLPEIDVETIRGVVMGYASQTGDLLQESIAEVFDFLRPSRQWTAKHKTTEKSRNAIQPKIIMEGMVDEYGLGHYQRKRINALDNLFHLLDGQGCVKYPDDLETKIAEALRRKTDNLTTDYFGCKWYRKSGTLHLTFRRLDLLKEFNSRAGNGYQVGCGEI